MAWTVLVESFFCIGQYAVGAESECNVFSASRWGDDQVYTSCEECLQQSRQCEKRCFDTNATCTAVGSRRRNFPETVQGDIADNQRKAERNVMQKCYNTGLNGCTLGQCSETMRFDPDRVTPCQTQTMTKKKKNKKSPPRVAPQPTQKYVTSWQHLKGKCQGRSTPNVAQQCGNRGFWHGISCRVIWSDGSTEDLHGKVDLTDPYARAYCTRSTRPAGFNCVNRCDDTNGTLMTLPRP